MEKIFSKEFITYCLVGLINTLVGISVAFICLNLFMLSYAVSTSLAYIFGSIVSFFLNKKYTFKNKDKSFIQFIKFFTTMLPAYIFSYWLGFEVSYFCFDTKKGLFYSFAALIAQYTSIVLEKIVDNFAVLFSMAIFLIVGFSINKFIVFKNKKESE